MPREDVTLTVGIDSKSALRGLSNFSKKAQSALRGLSSSLFSVQGLVAGVGAALASAAIGNAIAGITRAASRQEDAINSLNTALRTSGEFSEEASRSLQDFASTIQATTKFGDELILEQIALAKAFGATNDQAKEVTQAAVELAAATGKSLEEATRQVSKTLGGFAGELGEVNPAIKELTKDQLQAGEAARVLLEQYGGSAAAQLNTFSGAVAQTSNTFGDLQEQLGFTITRNPAVIKAIGFLNEGFQRLIAIVKNNEGSISAFVSSVVKGIAGAIPVAVRSLGFLVRAFEGIGLAGTSAVVAITTFSRAALSLDFVNRIVSNLINGFDLLRLAVVRSFEFQIEKIRDFLGLLAKIPGVGDVFKDLEETVSSFEQSVEEVGDTISDNFGENTIDTEAIKDSLQEIEQSALDTGFGISQLSEDLQNGIEVVATELDTVSDKIQSINNGGLQVPSAPSGGGGGSEFGEGAATNFLASLKKELPALIGNVFKGAEGARKSITKIFELGINALLPGAGAFAAPILDALSKGPEFVTTSVQAFVDELPTVIDNIAQALPALVTALAENVDEIIIALIGAIPALAKALAIEVPLALADPLVWRDVATALVAEVGKEITGVELEFSRGKLDEILNDFSSKFTGGLNRFLEDLSRPFQPLINALNNLANAVPRFSTGGGGGVGGVVGRITSAIPGLQTGGTIPGGFPNDSFAANLTSGELVVPRDDVTELRSFLSEQRRGGGELANMEETNALLSQLVSGQQSGGGVISISEDGLSDLLLEFSRRNERTVA